MAADPVVPSRWRSWLWIPALWFALLFAHGAAFGLTDDEAYYWVLAQHPAWGFAFHPPGVVWAIAVFQKLFGFALGQATPAIVRLPSALFSTGVLALGVRWMEKAAARDGQDFSPQIGAATLLALAGFFGVSWMMVPDLPLFFGWMLAFESGWAICAGETERRHLAGVFAGALLAVLAKYSGVLVAASCALTLLIWARGALRARALVLVGLAVELGMLPALWWNSRHEWGSLLYQLRDRQQGEWSLVRYARFWAIELLLAGPPLLAFLGARLRRISRWRERDTSYALLWMAPSLIYLVQPLWADFKPHWALAVWLPAALLLAREASVGASWRVARAQRAFALPLLAVALAICHWPLIGKVASLAGRPLDPRLDVTNDLYGWEQLPGALREAGLAELPVTASRYQTASQAAFALGDVARVSFVPRDLKQRDEWPQSAALSGYGPAWPRLLGPVVFVSDIRYDAPPAFEGARCAVARRIEARRQGLLAKWIDVWKCEPWPAPPRST
jgi:4-amino-4-deoxy-L-arabinose transferase-like glycosyltransferase